MAEHQLSPQSKGASASHSNKRPRSEADDYLEEAAGSAIQAFKKFKTQSLEEAQSWFEAFQSSVDANYRTARKLPTLKELEQDPPRPFQYQPLDYSQPSIRLVHLLPELSRDGLIQCRISHGLVSSSYACLSYVWDLPPKCRSDLGRQEETKERVILVNDLPLRIRENLFDFLWVARHNAIRTNWYSVRLDLSTPFWIDALCIDQLNLGERNHQVRQMGDIYSSARTVHVWLGTAPFLRPDTTSGDTSRSEPSASRTARFEKTMEYWASKLIPRDVSRYEYDCCYGSVLGRYIFENPYWERAWVVQEFFLARDLVIWLHTFPSRRGFTSQMRDAFLKHRRDKPSTYVYPILNYKHYNDYHFEHSDTKHKHNLLVLLNQFRDKRCEDPRDRVYSLLSLLAKGVTIPVDYNRSREHLAYSVLARHSRQLCLCTALTVVHALHLNEETRDESDVSGMGWLKEPWIELKVHAPCQGPWYGEQIWQSKCGALQNPVFIDDDDVPIQKFEVGPNRCGMLRLPLWRAASVFRYEVGTLCRLGLEGSAPSSNPDIRLGRGRE